jgi:hypothetical protein
MWVMELRISPSPMHTVDPEHLGAEFSPKEKQIMQPRIISHKGI